MMEMMTLLVGGLALFIFSIQQLSVVMNEAFSDEAQKIIERYTQNFWRSLLIGIVATIMVDSSSAVIILTIIFINAKLLDFRRAMGIIMGANIGTTFGAQLIAFDITQYAVYVLVSCLFLTFIVKNSKVIRYVKIGLYLGMLFFGLYIIEQSVMPLRDSPTFELWMHRVGDNPWTGALVGGLATLIFQSSGATVGLAIVFGKQQLISIAGGVAVMIGAELGTCSDTLLATINGSRQAVKAGFFHLIFNLLCIILGLVLFESFMEINNWISQGQSVGRQIANAHILFNVLGVLVFIPFVGLLEKMMNVMIPERVDS